MKENFTSINVIVDASGSMESLTTDTIGNFNGFLVEQQAVPGEAVLTLCVFNTDSRLVYDFAKIASVSGLTTQTYYPRGSTALLDAMGTTINSVGNKLALLPEDQRPSKVIFLIITDGHENASRHFTTSQIKEMVEHQKNKYSWEFVFMGANIDAITAGTNLGIDAHNTLNYKSTSVGTRSLYSTVGSSMSSYRASSSPKANFFNQAPVVDVKSNQVISTSVSTPKSKSKKKCRTHK